MIKLVLLSCIIALGDAACKIDQFEFETIRLLLGVFVPKCEYDGTYSAEQCDYGISQCWCATESGDEIPSTRISLSTDLERKRDCHEERLKFRHSGKNKNLGRPPSGDVADFGSPDGSLRRRVRQATTRAPTTTNSTDSENDNATTTGAPTSDSPETTTESATTPIINSPASTPNTRTTPGANETTSSSVNETTTAPSNGTSPSMNLTTIQPNVTTEADNQTLTTPENVTDYCGPNTVYSLCTNPCPNGCDQLDDDICNTTECVPGCVCSAGYVRERANDTNSACIRQSNCGAAIVQSTPSSQCVDPNSEWSTCGAPCEETCQSRPSDCPKQCAAGCFCKDGFVKESSNSSLCVPKSLCVQGPQPYQQPCPDPNAVLSNCGPGCEESCEGKPPNSTCGQSCVSGCFCKNGMIKESQSVNAKCVQRDQCQKDQYAGHSKLRREQQCSDPNAVWVECGTACHETCKKQSRYCTIPCTAGCFCIAGFVKSSNLPDAKCISRDWCPEQKLGRVGDQP